MRIPDLEIPAPTTSTSKCSVRGGTRPGLIAVSVTPALARSLFGLLLAVWFPLSGAVRPTGHRPG